MWWRMRERIMRILAVARVELLHLVRDRATIALVATVPAIQLVLFGYAVNLDPRAVPVAVAGNRGDPADPLLRADQQHRLLLDRRRWPDPGRGGADGPRRQGA